MKIMFIVFVIILLIILTGFWFTHLVMNRGEKVSGHRVWVFFFQFKKMFDRYSDDYHPAPGYETMSLWNKGEGGYSRHYMHASIVKIDNNIFNFITPFGYLFYELYKNWFISKHFDTVKEQNKQKEMMSYRDFEKKYENREN